MDTTLWKTLSDQVQQICQGRDPSHGWEHMKRVATNALIIAQDYQDIDINMVLAVAWLHDVADHKYDKDGKLQDRLKEVVTIVFNKSDDQQLCLNIIARISFSKEVQAQKDGNFKEWHQILGDKGMMIRNIVSDADKLEALGLEGFQRCKIYTEECYLTKNGQHISREELKKNVINHANEKLLRLKDEFIKTTKGKELAAPLHKELEILLLTL